MANRKQLLQKVYRYNLDLLKTINPSSVYTDTQIMSGINESMVIVWQVSGKEKLRKIGEVVKRLHRRLNPRKHGKKGEQLTIL